ncbi:flavin reductase [Vibrio sp. H11]|uniref:flavin reductase n=1 Tax=Vibrio sp. H11 TaxID=2565928 RepID=UPI00197F9F5F|nr:flavin reductase [Vibrio sp. H11]
MSEMSLDLVASKPVSHEMNFTEFAQVADNGVQAFKDGMASLGSAVNVVTTMVDGQAAGFTATAVTSVTDTPPTLLVCLNRSSSVFAAFDKAQTLCVNTLAAEQAQVSGLFAGKLSQQERFDSVAWQSFVTGAPVLAASSTAFDCKIASRSTVGTHEVFFCEIVGIGAAQQISNLVYFDRRYHKLT